MYIYIYIYIYVHRAAAGLAAQPGVGVAERQATPPGRSGAPHRAPGPRSRQGP